MVTVNQHVAIGRTLDLLHYHDETGVPMDIVEVAEDTVNGNRFEYKAVMSCPQCGTLVGVGHAVQVDVTGDTPGLLSFEQPGT